MGLFARLRRGGSGGGSTPGTGSGKRGEAQRHLADFAASRTGVEAFVEPATTVTPTTLLLVAHDGEWTRRRVPDPRKAVDFAKRVGIPVYDVNLTGYPQRMRDFNKRQRGDDGGPGYV